MIDRIPLSSRLALTVTTATFGAAMLLGSSVHAATIAEDWTGDNGDAWSSQWTITGDVGPTVSIQHNGGNIQEGGVGDNHIILSLINTETFTDSLQSIDFVSYESAFMAGGLIANYSSGAEGESHYWARVRKPSASGAFILQILKTVNGEQSALAGGTDFEVAVSDEQYSQISFSVQMVDSTAELETTYTDFNGVVTTLSATDTLPLAGAGQVGMRTSVTSNSLRFIRYDNYIASSVIPEPGSLALGLAAPGLTLPRRRQPRD